MGSSSSDVYGDCLLCNVGTAFLVGLGEERSRLLQIAVKLQLGFPTANSEFFPLPRKSGRGRIKSLASQLPPLSDLASQRGSGRRDGRSALSHRSLHVFPARGCNAPSQVSAHPFVPRQTDSLSP